MKHNMGKVERGLRVILGAVLLIWSFLYFNTADLFWGGLRSQTVTGLILSIIGLVIFITGASAYCPVNALFHSNSCEACRLGETHAHMPV